MNEWKDAHVIKGYSILFPKRGGAIFTNKKRITKQPLLADLNIMSVHPFFCFDYINIWFQGLDLAKIQSGSNIPQINNQDLEPLYIPLPPANEQKRIVKFISSIMSLVQRLQVGSTTIRSDILLVKAKILDDAMQGKLVPQNPSDEPAAEMLKRINLKAKIITDNPHYPKLPDNWVLTDIQSVCEYGKCESVSVEAIDEHDWILELEDIEKDSGIVLEKKLKSDRPIKGIRHRFQPNDILYSKLRTYLNKVLIADSIGYCSTEIIPVQCHESVIPRYLCAWLRSPYFLGYTQSCGYGVKMPRLSTTDAKKGIVPLPPLNEQKRIMEQIKSIFEALDAITNSLS